MLPSEFKEKWNFMLADDLTDAFVDFFERPEKFVQLIEQTIKSLFNFLTLQVACKLTNLKTALEIPQSTACPSLDHHLFKLLKSYSPLLFHLTPSLLSSYLSTLSPLLLPILPPSEITDLLNSSEFCKFLISMFTLLVHMYFNESKLEIPYSEDQMEFTKFDKQKHF